MKKVMRRTWHFLCVQGDSYTWSDGWPVFFTHWGPGEPTNTPDEGCVTMHGARFFHGTWNDTKCDEAKPYVCRITTGAKETKITFNVSAPWRNNLQDEASFSTVDAITAHFKGAIITTSCSFKLPLEVERIINNHHHQCTAKTKSSIIKIEHFYFYLSGTIEPRQNKTPVSTPIPMFLWPQRSRHPPRPPVLASAPDCLSPTATNATGCTTPNRVSPGPTRATTASCCTGSWRRCTAEPRWSSSETSTTPGITTCGSASPGTTTVRQREIEWTRKKRGTRL